ncbi:MAG: helix-turn-helix domain-containing protein [Flavonifractor plautii]
MCDYLEAHCDRRITLEQLSALAGLSKYHLLRCFTRQKGITPYRYLETVRVNRARALLEQGPPRWTRPCGRALPIRATSTTFSRS